MKPKTIFTFAKWQVKPGSLSLVLSLLKEVAAKSTAEPGNLQYQAFQANDNDHTILLFEEYKDQQAVDVHRASAHFQEVVVRQIVPLLENREVVMAGVVDWDK